MVRRTGIALLLLACVGALSGPLHAQTSKTITVRVLDGKTGQPISPSNLLIRINQRETAHSDWVRQQDDGTAEVKIPADASLLSVQATYDNSLEIYVNCDAAKQKDTSSEHWYRVSEILASGVVAPNECVKRRDADMPTVIAKPGEFVFFVRRLNWREQSRD